MFRGGVQFPTGGDGAHRLPSPRTAPRRCREGAIPSPTVTVRMEETALFCVFGAPLRLFAVPGAFVLR